MKKTFQEEAADRQRPEGGNFLGLCKEMQKVKVWGAAYGGKVNMGEKAGGPDTKDSAG